MGLYGKGDMKTYTIVSRWLERDKGWQREAMKLEFPSLQDAWAAASKRARALDEKYGNDHFWTVDLKNDRGESYVQLFHGRLA